MRALMLLACAGAEAVDSQAGRPLVDSLVGEELGGGVVVLAADPDPPQVGENTWLLQVAGDGLRVAPSMPEHGHGTVPPEFEGVEVEPGRFEVGPMPLVMSGLWEFELTVAADGVEGEPVVYTLWIEG